SRRTQKGRKKDARAHTKEHTQKSTHAQKERGRQTTPVGLVLSSVSLVLNLPEPFRSMSSLLLFISCPCPQSEVLFL
ncbi:hypothetical protein L249_4384, partial [Ophiocordyceps polyrhachis-furcata BCC 54312]